MPMAKWCLNFLDSDRLGICLIWQFHHVLSRYGWREGRGWIFDLFHRTFGYSAEWLYQLTSYPKPSANLANCLQTVFTPPQIKWKRKRLLPFINVFKRKWLEPYNLPWSSFGRGLWCRTCRSVLDTYVDLVGGRKDAAGKMTFYLFDAPALHSDGADRLNVDTFLNHKLVIHIAVAIIHGKKKANKMARNQPCSSCPRCMREIHNISNSTPGFIACAGTKWWLILFASNRRLSVYVIWCRGVGTN
ncbi:hypothetical protein R3P38DRAFT_2800003 [Favolaschia claudopus]|uniref:Uncharacterized protein n=1 Tax=Favolaschia claudopus TaxID=2862362 RepID=A0AAV9ZYL7_9AGAR